MRRLPSPKEDYMPSMMIIPGDRGKFITAKDKLLVLDVVGAFHPSCMHCHV